MVYAGEGADVGAEKAGRRDAALSAGGEGEVSDERAAAGGAAGVEYSDGGDCEEDGGGAFGGVRPGGQGAEERAQHEVDVAHGRGDGVQGGVRDCAEGREDAGGVGGEAALGEGAGGWRGCGARCWLVG